MLSLETMPAIPRGLTQPAAPPTVQRVMSRWNLFLGEIAIGTPLQEAMLKHLVKSAEIEACIRSSPDERQRWNDARLAARKTKWSALDIEEIFAKISGGTPIHEAIRSVRPLEDTSDFTYLCTADPELHEQYMAACRSRAVLTGEEIITIADGDGDDTLDNGKGGLTPHSAKVNRDKLRVDTRKALMSNWFPKLFGEKAQTQVNVQINNHAARLEEARARRDTRTVKRLEPAITSGVVDAAFKDYKPEAVKEAWDDIAEPVSTVWREG